MADNINLNGPYDTKVPSYNESADIQEALKLFLYGTTTPPSNQSEILSTSLAGNLKRIEADITVINNRGLGSTVSTTQPTGIGNGYVWLDSDSGIAASVPARPRPLQGRPAMVRSGGDRSAQKATNPAGHRQP